MTNTWQIIPGKLWQGDIFSLSNPDSVDVCVSCTLLSEIPTPFKLHTIWPIEDGPLPDLWDLGRVANDVAIWITAGRKVLVNCNQGDNRSGLVIGQAMMILGLRGILSTIQIAHPQALYNKVFAQYVASLG